ncbi:MAG TPA: glutamine synthetase beta-grasp domain-containing protein [Candidatus Kapabacteria bacterium]|nr:glutamine synthetase beta-grasp domain-containing protein [Candidatus Kapabacteria bacterium]
MDGKIEHFALENPVLLLAGKGRNELTRDDLIKVILEKQLERITFNYTGLDGKLKELKIPITSRKQAELILSEGERIDGTTLFKGIVEAGKSDLYIVPEYRTAFLNPFDDKSLNLICRFMDRNGELADYTPDNILRKAANQFRSKTGLDLYSFGELEFYLIGNVENNLYPLAKQKGYHATSPFVKTGGIMNEMLHHMSKITGSIKYAHNEIGFIQSVESELPELKGKFAEQVELEFLPTQIEDTADIMVLASWLIRNIAYKHNFVATFFPKIDYDHAGNSLYIHNAIMRDGKNIMTDSNGELTDEAMQLIGGLCYFAPTLTSFGNMISSSYLRLVPNHDAPTKVCWSESNRNALIRVPLAWSKFDNIAMKLNPQQKEKLPRYESRQMVELRSPDGSANAHLLLAGIALAAEWGVTNPTDSMSLAKNSRVSLNIQSNPNLGELSELATSCVESAEMLLAHRNLFEANGIFPYNVTDYIANVLLNENDKNLNKRLMSLPDDEKVSESRRIMHKHLHKH